MAQSEAQSSVLPVAPLRRTATASYPAPAERRLRRISAWLLLTFLLMGELGAVWDREWHAYVGRDQFWTPPHTMIYSCVAGCGLLALFVVLLETYRYYQKREGVDRSSTATILWFFHAPLGFSVLGFGALLALTAAPLDNYWHELYGIDVALWAPFHMMGVTGGMIGILGMIYIFASEAAVDLHNRRTVRTYLGFRPLELGALMAMASFLNFALTGFLQFPVVTVGTLHISTYPLPLVASGLFCMVSAVRFTHKSGAALLVVLFLLLHTWLVELFVPWAIRTAVDQQNIPYRIPGFMPEFSLNYAFLPVVFLISALVIDYLTARKIRQTGKPVMSITQSMLLGALTAIPIFLLAPWILLAYSEFAPVFISEKGIPLDISILIPSIICGVLAALVAGAVGAVLGADFGDIWRWSQR